MQLGLEEEDSAPVGREGKGKLQAAFLLISGMTPEWLCCRVFFKHTEDKYELTLIVYLHHTLLQIRWSLSSPKHSYSVTLASPRQKKNS